MSLFYFFYCVVFLFLFFTEKLKFLAHCVVKIFYESLKQVLQSKVLIVFKGIQAVKVC